MSALAIRHRRLIAGESRGVTAGVARAALGLAAVGYRVGVAVRNRMYDMGLFHVHRASAPVVSVGNLTLGGTGKTPMVEFLARRLTDDGRRVVILSRGYGATEGGRNDEALVLDQNLTGVPHLQGRDRVALAHRAATELSADVLLLDDGFQHRRLARDLDIVLVDATRPFGFGRLFPRGLLREPVRSLRRADLVVLTRADLVERDQRERIRRRVEDGVGAKPWVECGHEPDRLAAADGASEAPARLAGRPVAAFAGIGNPDAFWQTLRALGYRLVGTRELPDHHAYTAADLDELGRWAKRVGAEAAVTTQKDLVKIRADRLGDVLLRALVVGVTILEGGDELDRALRSLLNKDT